MGRRLRRSKARRAIGPRIRDALEQLAVSLCVAALGLLGGIGAVFFFFERLGRSKRGRGTMKKIGVIVVLLALVLLASCATLAPFNQADYRQIGKILKPYSARWGEHDYIEVHLQTERQAQAWVGFVWLEEGEPVHALVISYVGDLWLVVMER